MPKKPVSQYDNLGAFTGSPQIMTPGSYIRVPHSGEFTTTYQFRLPIGGLASEEHQYIELSVVAGPAEVFKDTSGLYGSVSYSQSGSGITVLGTRTGDGIGQFYKVTTGTNYVQINVTAYAGSSGLVSVIASDWIDPEISEWIDPGLYYRTTVFSSGTVGEGDDGATFKKINYQWFVDREYPLVSDKEDLEVLLQTTNEGFQGTVAGTWAPSYTHAEYEAQKAINHSLSPNTGDVGLGSVSFSNVPEVIAEGVVALVSAPPPGGSGIFAWDYWTTVASQIGMGFSGTKGPGLGVENLDDLEDLTITDFYYHFTPDENVTMPAGAIGWEWDDGSPPNSGVHGDLVQYQIGQSSFDASHCSGTWTYSIISEGADIVRTPTIVPPPVGVAPGYADDFSIGGWDYSLGTDIITVGDGGNGTDFWFADITSLLSEDETFLIVCRWTPGGGEILSPIGAPGGLDMYQRSEHLSHYITYDPPNFRWLLEPDPIWDDLPNLFRVRQYPRDDASGWGASPRIYPAPKGVGPRFYGEFG